MDNEQKPATLDDVVAILQKNQGMLEEIMIWSKINNVEHVKKILTETLNTPEKIIIYHLSDGRTIRDITAICGGSTFTISNYWKTWNNRGLMKSMRVSRGERFIKAFDLAHYDIDIPPIPKTKSQTATEQPKHTINEGDKNGN